jgi:glycosyltransferase involved in cell wall biosynthesis
MGTDHLSRAKAARNLENLILLPFQPVEALPDVLASADILTAFVEPEAGLYSVPSKLLSYFCAGRPVLAGIGKGNAAAREIRRHDLGVVVEPDDEAGYLNAAQRLLADKGMRERFGRRARQYAEDNFDIEKIAARFEVIFRDALQNQASGDRVS